MIELLLLSHKKNLYGKNISKPRIRKYDRIYNGKLYVVFDDRSHRKYSKKLKLEDRIDDIVIRLYEISENCQTEQERKEVQQKLYLEAVQREEKQRKRKQLEMERTLMQNISIFQFFQITINYFNIYGTFFTFQIFTQRGG